MKAGIIKPLPRTVFQASEVESAFRHMTTGTHIGKLLLKIRENPEDIATLPIKAEPRFYCNSDESFIIVGGLGGMGLEMCEWMTYRGCTKLIISSSRGISNQYQAYKIE